MKKVSIIVACRNEEGFIGDCLKSLIAQDYPKDLLEIIVVDGMSTDSTWATVESIKESFPEALIKLEANPKRFKYPGLNQALKEASGDVICIADAHSKYPRKYVSILTRAIDRRLDHKSCDNVGAGRIFWPRGKGWLSMAITLAQTEAFIG